ncbi:MAG TPA: hypothetical protein EYO51_02145 [Methylococcaceae bacterium]|nr:hypothetical protein [Methylococcaceae bacterium]HIN68734.1 hypothetical protein [Methylococcales bacterium]HIA44877.1 hypothetical protein [Methylococcaceae bacterium]HIB61956.1 hypothetical protein [Methylococcaceae bacterium]HIO12745.1 hypothetical protein [Methylococcales bacterium]
MKSGKPTHNDYIERFNRTCSNHILDCYWLTDYLS